MIAILLLIGLYVGALCAQEAPSYSVYVVGTCSDGISSQNGYWKNGVFNPMTCIKNNGIIAVDNGDVYSFYCATEYDSRRQKTDYRLKVYKNGEYLWSYFATDNMSLASMAVLNGSLCVGLEISGIDINGYSKKKQFKIIRDGQCVKSDAGRCMAVANGFLYYTADYDNVTNGYYAGGNYYKNPDQWNGSKFKANKMKVFGTNVWMYGRDNNGPCAQCNNEFRSYPIKGHGSSILDYQECYGVYYLMDNKEILTHSGNGVYTNILSAYNPIAMETDGNLLYILASKQQGAMKVFCVLTYNPHSKTITNTKTLPGCSDAWQLLVVED